MQLNVRVIYSVYKVTNETSEVSIKNFSLKYSTGVTHTDKALRYVRTDMLTPAAGDRPDVPNVVILMADGHSTNRKNTLVCILYTCWKWTFALKNFHSWERKFHIWNLVFTLPGAKIPWNFYSWERKYGETFAPDSEKSLNFYSQSETLRLDIIWSFTFEIAINKDKQAHIFHSLLCRSWAVKSFWLTLLMFRL